MISVVMAVYNGAGNLDDSIRSIVNQSFQDWELIVVNDGSTDDSASILSAWQQRESRLKVLTCANGGLTLALIAGCGIARGQYVARQDCGDFSRPDRLSRQFELLESDRAAVLASCGVAVVGPGRKPISEVHMLPDIETRLEEGDDLEIRSLPSHSSAFFRRSAYEAAGGYRPQFYYAQDLDLWTRMARLGRFITTPEILVEFSIDPVSISARARAEQVALTKLIVALRGATEAESRQLLEKASAIRKRKNRFGGDAAGYYFLSQLIDANDPDSRTYLLKALRENPLHWKAAVRLMTYWIRKLKPSTRRARNEGHR